MGLCSKRRFFQKPVLQFYSIVGSSLHYEINFLIQLDSYIVVVIDSSGSGK
jgi:hypothetical protein